MELLDTPGILWPKFEDQTVGLRLALIGSIKDEILNTEELGGELIRFLTQNYPGVLQEKYEANEDQDIYVCLQEIAKNRHCFVRGNSVMDRKGGQRCFWMISEMGDWEELHWNFLRILKSLRRNKKEVVAI